ncbi:ABC transporter ATP-binding protein [Leucobacter luti]|uniref:ABC-type dipeptide/oligopeptide/nickel transport system ATPase component n=1 Tax=Leucobacter luti TaxID=340320 RepID=A0A4R6RV66_9MICO|nr:ABC transporter ATP-binding protein [Leucobacter luti]MCW2289689.1 ABC-type glutathione transport system ATPase component [Leucobacter luti]QYM77143.1 ABC transporter ATP-binding protein [Leucobacter luti]TCK37859.1 ABC-type dipeptide/oligopeptide/nickel transport system ATPase component [Leucobacter luti]TDP90852.1 ABC-type dipeptide/oligopeptide/nickel transport system ATPase component [Leucobacter luti]
MLTIEDLVLTVTDPDTGQETEILHGNSLTLGAGEALGLVGESGSGKSMTLKCILGIEPSGARVDGRIELDGTDLLTAGGEQLRRIRAEDLALIAQNPHGALNPVLPVGRYLIEGMSDARGMSRADAERKAAELLREVGIDDTDRVLRSYPHQLSGGMLQRVVIAGAISGNPKLLLADEPTTALDVTTQAEVVAILDEMRRERGLSMIFVTHDLDLAAAVCDRLAVMKDGEILEIGTPEDIRDRPQTEYTRNLMAARPMLYPDGHPAAFLADVDTKEADA